jgi:hypothetical protein
MQNEIEPRECRGRCCNCDSDMITYGDSIFEDESVGFPYVCQKCGHEGTEWYYMDYSESY